MLRILLIFLIASKIYASELSDAFTVNNFVPKSIPYPPQEELYVMYFNQEEPVDLCVTLFDGNLSEPPNVTWTASHDKYYTLLMAGLGHRPTSSSLNWVVGNIPGNDISSGDVLSEYHFTNPTNEFNFIFLVYEQPDIVEFGSGDLDGLRTEGSGPSHNKLPIDEFAMKHNFNRTPLAGNCMSYADMNDFNVI